MICSIKGAAGTLVIACNNIGDIILTDISAKTYSFGFNFFFLKNLKKIVQFYFPKN